MNKTYHFFNDSIYLISSHAVARNPIFYHKKICMRFLKKVDYYLSPIAEILHYAIINNEFQLLVKLKDRSAFCAHYRNRKNILITDDSIPISTFIFSKAINDLLVSTAKHFNYHHKRKGNLFSHRFHRELIESPEHLEFILKQMNGLKDRKLNRGEWSEFPSRYKLLKNRKILRNMKERCARYYYENRKIGHKLLTSFRRINSSDRRGCFLYLPPKSIYPYYKRISILYFVPLNTS